MAWKFSLSIGKEKPEPVVQTEERSGNVYGPETNALYGQQILLGYNRSHAGVNVNEDSALGLTAVARCIQIIANSIAKLPRELMRIEDDGDRFPAKNHPYYNLISNKPGKYYNKFNWDRVMLQYRVGYGNAYAYIRKNKYAEAVDLVPLFPWAVAPYFLDGDLVYYNADYRYPEIPKILYPHEVFHLKGLAIDGFCGRSPIRQHAESIGIALATETFGATFFQNGGIPAGVIGMDSTVKPDQAKVYSQMWKEQNTGENANRTVVLGGGAKYSKIGVNPEEAQFIDSRKYGKLEVATIFGVPPHLLADLDRGTFSNIEQQFLEFVVNTLMEYAVEVESEFLDKVIPESEKGNYRICYDFSEMLRGDMTATGEFISKMISCGVFSINDGRYTLNKNRVDDGDMRFIQVNQMPLDKVGAYYDASTSKMAANPSVRSEVGFAKLLENIHSESIKNQKDG